MISSTSALTIGAFVGLARSMARDWRAGKRENCHSQYSPAVSFNRAEPTAVDRKAGGQLNLGRRWYGLLDV